MGGTARRSVPGSVAAAILAGVLILVPGRAVPEDSPKWGQAGDWQIRIDKTLDYGCFIVAFYEGGTVLRLGWSPPEEKVYVIIGNYDWASIESNKGYDVKFQFGDLAPWTSNATGGRLGDLPVLMSSVSDPDFVKEFTRQHYLRVFYRGDEIERLTLEDSAQAIQSMLECQQTIMSFEKDQHMDPFRKDPDDPFAR